MLDWLIADWTLFGVAGQNWMLVFGGGLLLYVVILTVAGRRRQGAR